MGMRQIKTENGGLLPASAHTHVSCSCSCVMFMCVYNTYKLDRYH